MPRFWPIAMVALLAGCTNLSKLLGTVPFPGASSNTPAPITGEGNKVWPVAKMGFFASTFIGIQERFYYYIFFPDGQCYRECPRGGYEDFSIFPLRPFENGNCGTYRVEGNDVRLFFPTEELVFSIGENTAYIEAAGTRYHRIRPTSFNALEGHYVRPMDPEHFVEFTADGGFTMDAGTWRLYDYGYSGQSDVSGHYSLGGNTMYLRRAGGYSAKTTFFTDPSDPATLSSKVIYIDRQGFRIPE